MQGGDYAESRNTRGGDLSGAGVCGRGVGDERGAGIFGAEVHAGGIGEGARCEEAAGVTSAPGDGWRAARGDDRGGEGCGGGLVCRGQRDLRCERPGESYRGIAGETYLIREGVVSQLGGAVGG